jgi:pimeloyl-ACP methyl ester carboxylesterase
MAIPQPNGPEVPAEMLNGLDGFSPGSQILMHFPQGVDVAASNASRLLEPECCGQPAGPPWIDTRTYNGRSLEPDSPTVLLDATTGERVLHFVENDGRPHDPARELFFMRPGVILTPTHRYIVAIRNLVAKDGSPVLPEPQFRVLRDGAITDVPAIEERRDYFETEIFPVLEDAGVERESLILAFDFVVGSEESLSGWMRSMRDQAYAWLDTVEADPEAVPFDVEIDQQNDCSQPGTIVWRSVRGTFQVPLFLTGDLDDATTPYTNFDENGVPLQNGFHSARIYATIPCSALDDPPVAEPVLMGHGLFQQYDLFPAAVPAIVNPVVPWTGLAAGTDWRGLSGLDLAWLGGKIIGLGTSELHNFPAFPARLRQGMLNTLVLARLMKHGILNRDPAFQLPGGAGVFPGPDQQLSYFGVSLGGIMGTYLAGLTPDIERLVLDVGAVNFSCMLPRATPFNPFFDLLKGIGLTDSMDIWLGIQLTHEVWAQAEPLSVIHHITSDPYPGSGEAKRILYTAAWLDNQVSNTCTEIAARTMNLPVLAGSIQQGLQGMPDVAGPVPSALVFHDLGQLDILNPEHAPHIPPLTNDVASGACDPHGVPKASTPTSILQSIDFARTGMATNFCSGLCDADVPEERPQLPANCPVAP